MNAEPQMFQAWPTSISAQIFDLPDLDQSLIALAEQIMADARSAGSFFFSRRKTNCFRDYRSKALRDLGHLVFDAVDAYLAALYQEKEEAKLAIAGWPMIQPYGHGVPSHHHIGNHLTAIYYCAVPPLRADAPISNSGHLILHDPRPTNRDWEPVGELAREFKYFELAVKTGMLVIFPGYVTHSVQPWFGDAPRVCFAMNLMTVRTATAEPMLSRQEFEVLHG